MISKPRLYGMIPKQPHMLMSYLVSGKLLHISVVLFVIESWIYGSLFQNARSQNSMFWSVFWGVLFVLAFAHIFLVLADGWSRFQDYKRAKDQLFMYGFQLKIINQFANSHCQRTALTRAAQDLGIGDEAKNHFRAIGYRWYHLIPDFMMKDPFFFYKRYFWRRTFLERHYTPKFNYRELSMELIYNDIRS